jgi:predicted dehydrogenase
MNLVRFGIAGLGNMGSIHAHALLRGQIPRARLAAVADPVADLSPYGDALRFTSTEALIASGEIDALLIVTPHFLHTTLGVEALKAGLHVLVEKPISVHKADAEKLIAAHTNPKQVFGAMFNQRTDPHFIKLREWIRSGQLGAIHRMNWTITSWFRTEAYYNSGGWRATWSGEGGGVLLNQCPHNLDLWQWLFGMPDKVRAHCEFGRFHNIEVEDSVTAFLEYPNGVTGSFITSTGEAPGVNRLEIAAERGHVLLDNGRLTWNRTAVPVSEFSHSSPSRYALPPVWNIDVPIKGHGEQHIGVLKNFVAAVLDGTPLIAPAAEGLHSIELANAMLMSTFQDRAIDLPIDAAAYAARLNEKIAQSRGAEKLTRIPLSTPAVNEAGCSYTVHPSYLT